MDINSILIDERFIYEAIQGARLSYGSGDKSDSFVRWHIPEFMLGEPGRPHAEVEVGPSDRTLCLKLLKAGSGHAKFMRTIPLNMWVTASSVWWRQLDQHKIGVVTQSGSTMHRAKTKGPFTPEEFLDDHTDLDFHEQLGILNRAYQVWADSPDSRRGALWEKVIARIPASYCYKRHISLNYAVLRGIVAQRYNHRWGEWAVFLDAVDQLPQSWLITAHLAGGN